MRGRLKSRTATALVALVIGCWATLAAADTTCTSCTQPNGRGIYVVDNEHHCFHQWLSEGRIMRFCPEAFIEVQPPVGLSRVELAGRLFEGKPAAPVEAVPNPHYKISATYKNQAVKLVGVETKNTDSKLVFYLYRDKANPRVPVQGAELAYLTLKVPAPLGPYLLTFAPVTLPSTLPQYTVQWKLASDITGKPKELCTGIKNTMSLLPSKRVDGGTGKVFHQDGATTISCESGAIIPCMKWGYSPSRLPYKDPEENQLLGACIQAKRAAYFLSLDDTKSYTKDGKAINMKDRLPIPNYTAVKDEPISTLEAIWTENGATCLNPLNRRTSTPPLPVGIALPPCGPWPNNNWAQSGGIIATGIP